MTRTRRTLATTCLLPAALGLACYDAEGLSCTQDRFCDKGFHCVDGKCTRGAGPGTTTDPSTTTGPGTTTDPTTTTGPVTTTDPDTTTGPSTTSTDGTGSTGDTDTGPDPQACLLDTECEPLKCIAGQCLNPEEMGSSTKVVHVAAGHGHTCMIMASGKMRCMGSDTWKQLGTPTPTTMDTCREKFDVDLGDANDLSVVAIAMGSHDDNPYDNEGFTCAQLSAGDVKCWGHGRYPDMMPIQAGWLGYGDKNDQTSDLSGFLPLPQRVQRIDAGYLYTCALLADNSSVACWGRSGENLLGYSGNGQDVGDDPMEITSFYSDISELAVGSTHSCALKKSGELDCWGENTSGEVGEGNTGGLPPQKVQIGGTVTALSAGRYHTCAVVGSKNVYCWGGNMYKQLGNDNPPSSPTPVEAVGVAIDPDEEIAQIVSGHAHNCVLVVGLMKKRVLCWGLSDFFQLGPDSPQNQSSEALAVPLGSMNNPPVQLSAHLGSHTCARLKAGELYCWGANQFGQSGCYGGSKFKSPTKIIFE